ncbi:hypothetical protein DUI87_27228 [Hirundo rustica rustica]|uniref:ribonuclease H n=1 Tax=Hirundo rustica rustica TaxID=333673 RepID=A0A3M0J503_HIRRU|nr:hypothetical protein DUI87_27228 [Hirundo rustica rustica]
MVIGDIPNNLLGMDVLAGRQWEDSEGFLWSFGTPPINIRLLQTAPALPYSKTTNVKQYPLPSGAKEGIKTVTQDLRDQGVIVNTHSPFNSPVWPVRKPKGKWRLTVDFCRLNANTDPLRAAVPNLAELITSIQEKAHSIMATIDVKDMFFMILIQPEDMDSFAFTWEGQQYTFTRIPQGYKHSPTLAHHALAKELEKIPKPDNVDVYQYIDDILVGGDEIGVVGDTQQEIITHLESLNLQIPSEKIRKPSQEVKFLGIWWKEGMTCIPPDTLTSLDQIKMPESRKDLQQALGLLVFWRKHNPDFSIIARPLYDLLRKGVKWDWTPAQEEALQLLIFEATAHQALGPIHPTDPFQVEWGFASSGLSIHIRQRGPEGPTRPVGFYSHGFKDAKKRYTIWEKGLFVVSLALIEVEKITRQQLIVLRGPFKVIKAITMGTPPPEGVAQRASVRKWYAQIEYYCNTFSVTEGAVKNLAMQETESLDNTQEKPAPVIKVAPPFSPEQSTNSWFTDASARWEGKVWRYRAAALHISSGERIITEGEGSAQVGELIAVWSVFQHEVQNTPLVCIYTDSYAVYKGCTEWLPFWQQNGWEVDRIPVWQKEKWQENFNIASQGNFAVGWVASHQTDGNPPGEWNNKDDELELARLSPLKEEQIIEDWDQLLEWLHVKRQHTGAKDLYKAAHARGWPVTREMCRTSISACEQCCKRLERHPLEDDPLHLREGKGLWDAWQVDYIGPFKKSGGKHFVLVGVEITSGLVQANAFQRATGDNTVKALQDWFGTFPKPQEIQSDNRSHFTARVVQDWAKSEGMKWVFHTPYYPQANGIIERTNGLLK